MYEQLVKKIFDLIPERRESSQYYTASVLKEAADAIEELSKRVQYFERKERQEREQRAPFH